MVRFAESSAQAGAIAELCRVDQVVEQGENRWANHLGMHAAEQQYS